MGEGCTWRHVEAQERKSSMMQGKEHKLRGKRLEFESSANLIRVAYPLGISLCLFIK